MSRHLIIFIRNPELGKVKTRLAATVGIERALEVYLKLLEITRNAALGVDCQRHLYYVDAIREDDPWDSDQFMKHVQAQNDLGGRMMQAHTDSFAKGAEKVIIIGSDCPEMSAEIIDEAFSRLDTADVVLGPAYDGGYYLLGLKKVIPQLFANKPWSTSDVLKETLEDIQQLGLTAHLLATLNDLDDETDLIRSGL